MGDGSRSLSYRDLVAMQCRNNPCLVGLSKYLSSKTLLSRSTIFSIIYPRDGGYAAKPVGQLNLEDINGPQDIDPTIAGHILLVQDIEPDVIDALGCAFDIDPLFFASHISTDFGGIEKAPPPPSLAFPPSLLAERGYVNIHYQRVLDLGDVNLYKTSAYTLKTPSNIPRNVRRLPPIGGCQLGLARGCCSILVKNLGSTWICTYFLSTKEILSIA